MGSKRGIKMNKYQVKLEEINQNGFVRDQLIAGKIIEQLESELNQTISFGNNMTNNLKIMCLLSTEYRDYVKKLLKENGYSLRAELFYLLGNLGNGANSQYMTNYDSIIKCEASNYVIKLKTIFGQTDVFKLNKVMPQLQGYIIKRQCHNVCEEFIEHYSGCQATTALLDSLFGGWQYHSFIENEGYVLDLSSNTCMKKDKYYQLLNPIVLNSVTNEELRDEEVRINSKESLGKEKSLLLRLALDKQVSKNIY